MRKLTVRRDALADLGPDELAGVAGGVTAICPTYRCTGVYPTLHRCEVPTIRECIYWEQTNLCE